jgi:glycerol kinase
VARILSIDEGTTGVRGAIVDEHGTVLGSGYREFAQHFPKPGWVEHDADEIWAATLDACAEALESTGTAPADVTCVGITNQRETAVVWERSTGRPIHHAIVWQDRRTAGICDQLKGDGHADHIRATTGLVLDAYFSGTKVAWMLDHVDGARARAEAGELAFGTVDSWLVWNLTDGASHVTEPSNACRTMLWDLRGDRWSDTMCQLLGVPATVLPEVRDSAGHFGQTVPARFLGIDAPITGIAGDQQAALFGQGCWSPGTSKNTYGTGSFLLLNTGQDAPVSEHGLLTSAGWRINGRTTYVLEGAIFVTGAAVQWLRDGLGIVDDAAETQALASQVPPGNEGVYMVPAFVGLGAPHWDPYARGTIVGITRGTGRGHLARAALEAMAYQSADVVDLMERESGQDLVELRVDGGAAANELLCQFQADILGVPVLRPALTETTVLGAAFLAGLGAGIWANTDELADVWQLDQRFTPAMDTETRQRLRRGWGQAVDRSKGWAHLVDEA